MRQGERRERGRPWSLNFPAQPLNRGGLKRTETWREEEEEEGTPCALPPNDASSSSAFTDKQ